MNTESTVMITRAQLQVHVDMVISQVMLKQGNDVETRGRLVRCLLRRAVRELLEMGAPSNPSVLVQALMGMVIGVVKSMTKKGELKPAASNTSSEAN